MKLHEDRPCIDDMPKEISGISELKECQFQIIPSCVYFLCDGKFEIAREKTGIQNFDFHDLRHAFAARLAQREIDLYKISKLLGHCDIHMTQRYTYHCPKSLSEGIEVLEKVDYNLTTVGVNRTVSTT